MSNGNGHRWSKFWWQDWQNDPALKQCSFAAQGLWMRLLCLAHEAARGGCVLINGRMPAPRQLVAQVGGTEREVAKLLAELETEGVFSRDPDGTIYSRRMRRDEKASEAGKSWGVTGGNPALNGRDSTPKKPHGGLTPPPNPTTYPPPLTTAVNQGGYPPPLTGGVKLESEVQAETEPEKEKKVSNLNNLPSTSPVLARAETHDEAHAAAVRQLQADALQVLMNEAGIAEPVTETTILEADEGARLPPSPIAAGPTKAHVNRVAKARAMQIPQHAVRGPVEQIERIEAQPEVADAAGLKWRPAEAARTLEQQIAAALAGCSEDQIAKAAAYTARFQATAP